MIFIIIWHKDHWHPCDSMWLYDHSIITGVYHLCRNLRFLQFMQKAYLSVNFCRNCRNIRFLQKSAERCTLSADFYRKKSVNFCRKCAPLQIYSRVGALKAPTGRRLKRRPRALEARAGRALKARPPGRLKRPGRRRLKRRRVGALKAPTGRRLKRRPRALEARASGAWSAG